MRDHTPIIDQNCMGPCYILGKCTAFVLDILSFSALASCMRPLNSSVVHFPQPTVLLQILSQLGDGTSVKQKGTLHWHQYLCVDTSRVLLQEENFSEALSNASKVWAPPRMCKSSCQHAHGYPVNMSSPLCISTLTC